MSPAKRYFVLDNILPDMELPSPCPVKIKIKDGCIFLYVGARDWSWDFETGKFIGAGTLLCSKDDSENERLREICASKEGHDMSWADKFVQIEPTDAARTPATEKEKDDAKDA